jgi:hypothetical protein
MNVSEVVRVVVCFSTHFYASSVQTTVGKKSDVVQRVQHISLLAVYSFFPSFYLVNDALRAKSFTRGRRHTDPQGQRLDFDPTDYNQ